MLSDFSLLDTFSAHFIPLRNQQTDLAESEGEKKSYFSLFSHSEIRHEAAGEICNFTRQLGSEQQFHCTTDSSQQPRWDDCLSHAACSFSQAAGHVVVLRDSEPC